MSVFPCKYSCKTTEELCQKCRLDNTLHYGWGECYCILYKPSFIKYILAAAREKIKSFIEITINLED